MRDEGLVTDETVVTDAEHDPGGAKPDRWRTLTSFAVLIVIASVVPIPSGVFAGGGGDGGAVLLSIGLTDPFHVVGYAVFAALATRLTSRTTRGLLLAIVGAIAFGFGIELLQAQIPWRTFAWRDVAVNAVGASIGAAAAAAYGRRRGGDSAGR